MKTINILLFLLSCCASVTAQDAENTFLETMLDNSLPNEWDKRNFLRYSTEIDTLYCFSNLNGERNPVGRTIYSYNSNQQIDTLKIELFKPDFQRYLEKKTYVYTYDEQGRIVEKQEICFQCFNNLQPLNRRTFVYSNQGVLDTVNVEYFEPNGVLGTWELYERDIYLNDLDGKVISITTQGERGRNYRRKLFFYDNDRRVVEIHHQDFSFGEWYTEEKEKFSDYQGEIAGCITVMRNNGHEFYSSERWLLEIANEQVFSIAHSDWYNEEIDAWQCEEQTEFKYDSNGQLKQSESSYYTYVDLEMRLMERTQRVHIPSDQFILDTTFTEKYYLREKGWFNDRKNYRKQTTDGQPIVNFGYRWNVKNGGWVISSYDSIYYNQTGQILERYHNRFSHSHNSLISYERINYQYDARGNQIYAAYAERADLQSDFVLVRADSSIFDENNFVQTTNTYEYNNQNTVQLTERVNYEYNDEQLLVSKIQQVVRTGDTLMNLIRYRYEYDENKRLARETYEVFTDNVWTNRRRVSYEYDSEDNIIVEQVESSQFGEWVITRITDFSFSNQLLEQSRAIFLNRFADTVWQINRHHIYNSSNQLIQTNQEELRDRYDWVPFANCVGYNKTDIVAQSNVYPSTDFCEFPNPYRRGSSIRCEQLPQNEHFLLRIFDLQGRLLQQRKITVLTDFHLNFSMESGMYIIQLLGENGLAYSERIVIY